MNCDLQSLIAYYLAMDDNGFRSSSKATAVNFTIFLLGLASLIASFIPGWHFWALDSFGVYPIWLRILLFALLFVTVIPFISRYLGRIISDIFSHISEIKGNSIYISIIILMIILFIAFRSENLLLGDGFNVRANVAEGMYFWLTEPLDYFMHHIVFLFTSGGEAGAQTSYVICSYIAGISFFIGLLIFIKDFSERILAFGIALAFAVMQFFFGYVENYTLSFVAMILYLLSANRDLDNGKISIATIIFLGLAIGFHLNSLALVPSFAYLLYVLQKRKTAVAIMVAWILAALAIAVEYSIWQTQYLRSAIFVPILPRANNPYHLFSPGHIADYIKLILLDFPLIILIPILWRFIRGSRWIFLIFAIIPSLLFTFIVDPKIGFMRDWDLMSLGSAPVMIFLIMAVIVWCRNNRQEVYEILIPLVLFSIMHTGSWIYQNSSRDRSYGKVLQFVHNDIHYSGDFYKGYLNKAWGTIIYKYYDDIDEVIRADRVRYDAEPNDALNVCNLADNYLIKGDTLTAIEIARANWVKFISNSDATLKLADIMIATRHYDDALKIYNYYIGQGGNDHRVIFNLAMIEDQRGNADSAVILYNKAFANWKDAPIGDEMGFYLKTIMMRKYNIGMSGLTRIYDRIPDQYRISISRLLAALHNENYALADSLSRDFMASSMPRQAITILK